MIVQHPRHPAHPHLPQRYMQNHQFPSQVFLTSLKTRRKLASPTTPYMRARISFGEVRGFSYILSNTDAFWVVTLTYGYLSARFLSCMSLHTAVPGILITGRQGMGKTSVAKEIARRLEADERVYACE
jgi:Cdc6-like AAA superfamily ATPase